MRDPRWPVYQSLVEVYNAEKVSYYMTTFGTIVHNSTSTLKFHFKGQAFILMVIEIQSSDKTMKGTILL